MLILNREVTVKRSNQTRVDKEVKTVEEIVATNLRCRIQSNRSYNQFDQKEAVLGKIEMNKLVMFSRSPIPKGCFVVDNKTLEEWTAIGESSDMAGNNYLFFIEVEVKKR